MSEITRSIVGFDHSVSNYDKRGHGRKNEGFDREGGALRHGGGADHHCHAGQGNVQAIVDRLFITDMDYGVSHG